MAGDRARVRLLEAELRHVLRLLPGPIWNARRVLVWSALDIERIRRVLKEKN
jgi:hypothetical protein